MSIRTIMIFPEFEGMEIIDEIREKTISIALTYGIQSLSLFGSYARNEANDKSDVDICIEKGSLRSLLLLYER